MTNIYDVLMSVGICAVVALFCLRVVMIHYGYGKTTIKWPKCFPFHDWGNWTIAAEGEIGKTTFVPLTGYKMTMVKGYSIRQQKICKVCDKIKLRTEQTTI